MLKGYFHKSSKETKSLAVVLVLVAMLGPVCWRFHEFVFAVAWHCRHGDYADVAGRKIKIPLLWWKENSHYYQTFLLRRALPSDVIGQQDIEVGPMFPGTMTDSNDETLRLTEKIISSHNAHPDGHTFSSLVTLHSGISVFYCDKEDLGAPGNALQSNLHCHASGLPYSFSFNGSPAVEKEAESILSTLQ